MSVLSRQPVKATYRIGQGRGHLLKSNHQPNQGFRSPQPSKLKPHLRYSTQTTQDNKSVLLNTVIEEHLLKFGFIHTFDTFIREAAEKSVSSQPQQKQKLLSGEEMKDKLLEVTARLT